MKNPYPNSQIPVKLVGKISSYAQLKKIIDRAKPNTLYVFDDFYYQSIVIDYSGNKYSWSADRNYYKAGRSGYQFPGKGNIVTDFKTIEGCKKNLIKYLEWLF